MYQNELWCSRAPVAVSASIGALQKLPTWLGPPCSLSSRFQSIQPTVQRFRSLIIERA